jgi:hypothetical protein
MDYSQIFLRSRALAFIGGGGSMLKTLDILIGVATVMLLFSMAVTIVTQFVANLMQSRGKNLLQGLTGLLKQIDPNLPAEAANKIAETVLKHPLVAEANGRLGEVIHREEFTTLLMGLAAGEGAAAEKYPLRGACAGSIEPRTGERRAPRHGHPAGSQKPVCGQGAWLV